MRNRTIDMMSIDDIWNEYADKVFENVEVSEVQYRETRLGFYAGAWAALNMTIQISEQDEITAIGNLDKLRGELEKFLRGEVGRKPMAERLKEEKDVREQIDTKGESEGSSELVRIGKIPDNLV